MFLLKTLSAVIEDPKLAPVMADWLDDFAVGRPEATAYAARLRNWSKLRLTTLLETVAKFGTKQERHLIKKVVNVSFSMSTGRRGQRKVMREKCLSSISLRFLNRLRTNLNGV